MDCTMVLCLGVFSYRVLQFAVCDKLVLLSFSALYVDTQRSTIRGH